MSARIRAGLLAAATAVLAAPGVASASHVAGGTYAGTVTTGQGGTVTLDVSAGGDTVDVSFNGLGNVSGTCTGVGFSTGEIPITDHGFSYSANGGQVTASGTFGKSSVGGGAQVLTNPCTTGSQAWRVVDPDASLGTATPGDFLGLGVFDPTGAGQTQQRSAKRGKSADFDLHVVNQGTETASFLVKGCKSSTGFKVTYSDETGNVTNAVTGGSYETDELAPSFIAADDHELALKIKALSSAEAGRTKTCKLVADSGLLIDAVKAKLKVKAG